MPNLEIITIGTELLLGEIIDTNSTYIARTLRDHGIDIFRITTIGDNPGRIASAIRDALTRADIVITTGGLGPTVDDPTRQAVAKAVGSKLIFDPNLWEDIESYFAEHDFKPTENNRRQAFIPEGSIPVKNPVGTAPCFIIETGEACVISLPGVPREMEFILHQSIIPFLSRKFILNSQIIKATVLHAASIGESTIDEKIADLETLSNPTVGLLAHPGQVDIRVTSKADSESEALQLSKPIIQDLKSRLGENIYGQDEDTLELIISRMINRMQINLGLVEVRLDGRLTARIKKAQPNQFHYLILDKAPESPEDFKHLIHDFKQENRCNVCLGIWMGVDQNNSIYLFYLDDQQQEAKTRKYGGPHEYIPLWAENIGLDFLRRHLLINTQNDETGES